MLQGHGEVHRALVAITRGVQDVVTLVRKEAALISAESSRSHRSVGSARQLLDAAFAEHQRACRRAWPGRCLPGMSYWLLYFSLLTLWQHEPLPLVGIL